MSDSNQRLIMGLIVAVGLGGILYYFATRLGGKEVTSVKDILDNPEEYASKTVTVEGTFGGRTTLAWMEGLLFGVYDDESNGLTIEISQDIYVKYAETAKSDKEYMKMMDEFHERMNSMGGKKVRVTGDVGVSYMEIGWADAPVLIVSEENIGVI